MLINNLLGTTPRFVNELGIKWWLEPESTNYVRKSGQHPDLSVWVAQHPDASSEYVLFCGTQIEYTSTSLEGICAHADMLHFATS